MFIININSTIFEHQRKMDAIKELCEALVGRGYDKLQQWRRGEIDRVNPDDASQLIWEEYLYEESERAYNDWLKKNPYYSEDLNHSGGCYPLTSMIMTFEEENNKAKDEE